MRRISTAATQPGMSGALPGTHTTRIQTPTPWTCSETHSARRSSPPTRTPGLRFPPPGPARGAARPRPATARTAHLCAPAAGRPAPPRRAVTVPGPQSRCCCTRCHLAVRERVNRPEPGAGPDRESPPEPASARPANPSPQTSASRVGQDEQENRRQAGRRRHLGDLAPEALGGVAGPVRFDPAHEQLRPGTREDRDDAPVRQRPSPST